MDIHNSDKKTTLFWSLVIGIFIIVFLFWLPGFIQSIGTIAQSMGTQTRESSSAIEDTVTPQIEELKKTFDTLLKQIPTEPARKSPPPRDSNAPESAGTISGPRHYCEQAGGIHQSRSGCTVCDGKTPGKPYDVCIFLDGSECEQEMFQKGECKKGQTQAAEDLMRPAEAY